MGPSSPSWLEPLLPEHSPELKEEFESFFDTLGFVPNSVLTMQRSPRLVKAFVQMQRALWHADSTVDRGLKRLLAHAASRAVGDAYSMAHTASGALHFGIDPRKIAGLTDYNTSPLFSEAERATLDLTFAASSTPNMVSDRHFVALRKHWNEQQIVEIVGVISMAGFLSRWNTTLATPLEAEPNQIGEQYLAPLGWLPGKHRR